MKKFWKFIFKLIKKLVVIGLVGFVATFALYMFNGENKLIYYTIILALRTILPRKSACPIRFSSSGAQRRR